MPADLNRPVFVLDACAVLALLFAEEGADVVEEILSGSDHRCLIHAINACEVYYNLLRRDVEEAAALEGLLLQSGVEVCSDLSADLWQAAGRLKAHWKKVSLADCLAVALAVRDQGALVTSDHHELDRLAAAKVCTIRFIR